MLYKIYHLKYNSNIMEDSDPIISTYSLELANKLKYYYKYVENLYDRDLEIEMNYCLEEPKKILNELPKEYSLENKLIYGSGDIYLKNTNEDNELGIKDGVPKIIITEQGSDDINLLSEGEISEIQDFRFKDFKTPCVKINQSLKKKINMFNYTYNYQPDYEFKFSIYGKDNESIEDFNRRKLKMVIEEFNKYNKDHIIKVQ